MLRKLVVESRTIKSEAFSSRRPPGVGEWIEAPWGIPVHLHVHLRTSATQIGNTARMRNSRADTALSIVGDELDRTIYSDGSKEETKTRFHQETLELIFIVD